MTFTVSLRVFYVHVELPYRDEKLFQLKNGIHIIPIARFNMLTCGYKSAFVQKGFARV